ncbi:hypothetical protein PHLH6_37610 [Pseudomonas sp. Seg1]|nr:hypothetical protein PHLH6_37610 [Pseudomonas sp. Seg1]
MLNGLNTLATPDRISPGDAEIPCVGLPQATIF